MICYDDKKITWPAMMRNNQGIDLQGKRDYQVQGYIRDGIWQYIYFNSSIADDADRRTILNLVYDRIMDRMGMDAIRAAERLESGAISRIIVEETELVLEYWFGL